MSYVRFKMVQFGDSYASLATVGYALYNADNTINGSRITAGITERGTASGNYGALITFPDDFRGELRWDTGEVSPKFAPSEVNPEIDNPLDIADEVDGYSLREAHRIYMAALGGKSSGGPANPVYRAADDSKARITSVADANGNRTAVTLDVT